MTMKSKALFVAGDFEVHSCKKLNDGRIASYSVFAPARNGNKVMVAELPEYKLAVKRCELLAKGE